MCPGYGQRRGPAPSSTTGAMKCGHRDTDTNTARHLHRLRAPISARSPTDHLPLNNRILEHHHMRHLQQDRRAPPQCRCLTPGLHDRRPMQRRHLTDRRGQHPTGHAVPPTVDRGPRPVSPCRHQAAASTSDLPTAEASPSCHRPGAQLYLSSTSQCGAPSADRPNTAQRPERPVRLATGLPGSTNGGVLTRVVKHGPSAATRHLTDPDVANLTITMCLRYRGQRAVCPAPASTTVM